MRLPDLVSKKREALLDFIYIIMLLIGGVFFMKITKDDWVKIATPIIMIAIGILLACSVLDGVRTALDVILGVCLIIIGSVYLALAFVKSKNVLDFMAIIGLGFIGVGIAMIEKKSLASVLLDVVSVGIGWFLFIFGCLGFVFSLIYIIMKKRGPLFKGFYIFELCISVVAGVIGGLLVFPINNGVIPDNIVWIIIGSIIAVTGLGLLIFTLMDMDRKSKISKKNNGSTVKNAKPAKRD